MWLPRMLKMKRLLHYYYSSSQTTRRRSQFQWSRVAIWTTIVRLVLLLLLVTTGSYHHHQQEEENVGTAVLPSTATAWTAMGLPRRLLQQDEVVILRSVLIDPIWTVDHVREAGAIRQLFVLSDHDDNNNDNNNNSGSKWSDAYNSRKIHLPPLLLSAVEVLLRIFSSATTSSSLQLQTIAFGIFLIVMDYWIAKLLEQLAQNIIPTTIVTEKSDDDDGDDDDDGRMIRDDEEDELLEKMDPKIRPHLSHIFPITTTTSIISTQQLTSSDTTTGTTTTTKTTQQQQPLFRQSDLPHLIASLYYASPVTILATTMGNGCFQNFKLFFLVSALHEASAAATTLRRQRQHQKQRSNLVRCAVSLSIAAYLDVHCLSFLIPILLLLQQQQQNDDIDNNNRRSSSSSRSSVLLGLLLLVYSLLLQGLSLLLVGGRRYLSVVSATHGHSFQLASGSAPSLTTLWYFNMQVFPRFHRYFAILLGGIPYLLIPPTVIRLHKYPVVLIAIFWLLRVLFRPPGTLYDLNVALCFMLFSPKSLARMSQPISVVCLCAIPIPVILYMVSYWMWIVPGTGEANYLYFQCLAYGVFVSLLLLAFSSASIRRDKALRFTEKSLRKAKAKETKTEKVE